MLSVVPTEDFFIIELYDFSPSIKTAHLTDMFAPYENRSGGFRIKWIDDTRALAVFDSASVGIFSSFFDQSALRGQVGASGFILTLNLDFDLVLIQPSKHTHPTSQTKSQG